MRVKKGKHAIKRRRSILRATKGYRHGRSKKEREAKVAVTKALVYARAHRRDRKSDFRKLWNIKINAGVRPLELSYSKFINLLTKKNVGLDRKILANLAEHSPTTFAKVVEFVK